MREVSCKVLAGVFRELKRKRQPETVLLDGIPYSLEHLRNKHERIEWSVYLRFLANARKVWQSDDEWVELGGAFLRSPLLRAFTLPASLLFTPRDFYRWLNTDRSGAGNQMFTCVRPSERELGPNRLEIVLKLDDGYEMSREFMLQSKGSVMYMPTVLGLPPSQVEMEIDDRGGRFDVRYPTGGGALRRAWRAVLLLFTAHRTARELKESNEVLHQRYAQLEEARHRLELQAAELTTAREISDIVRSDLDVDRTLAAVGRALTESGGFAGVEVTLAADSEGRRFERNARFGSDANRERSDSFALTGHLGTIGRLEVWPVDSERRQLLVSLVPTVTMALTHAITHRMVLDYQANLERRVEERTAELREAQAARDRIFANVNHEIRTPLSLMKLALADIRRRDPALDARTKEQLGNFESGTRKLLNLIDGILLLAAGQARKLELRPEPIDVAALLRSLAASWQPAAATANIALVLQGPERCVVSVDGEKLERIVTNLVSNAFKFTPAGGRVALTLSDGADAIRISVVDSGVGIAPELRARLFNRFEQGAIAPLRGSKGSGIGLSLVKELVELHGGKIAFADVAAGGSDFTVELPRRAARIVEPLPAPDDARVLPHDLGLTQNVETEIVQPQHTVDATILVAEDQPQLRAELGRLLGEHYKVILASDGQRALELVRRHLPDLIVTDIQMPRMNGFELIDAVHELKEIRVPAVIMLTTFDSLGNRVKGFEGGALDCVAKPFEPAELLARIRTQLQNRKRAARTAEIERLASLGTTIKGFMHELRNPVNAIVHLLELMPEMLPEAERHRGNQLYDFIALASEAAGHLKEMSNDLLGADTRGELRMKPVAIASVVQRARALLSPDVGKLRFVETHDYDGLVSCSERMMAQVLANLFTNAGQAAGDGGWIGLSSRASDGRLVLEVSDSGPGVPVQLRERIFDLYFTTKDPGEGTGMGLYISRRIVEQHGGTLAAKDGVHGTVFVIEIPLDGAAQLAPRAAAGESH